MTRCNANFSWLFINLLIHNICNTFKTFWCFYFLINFSIPTLAFISSLRISSCQGHYLESLTNYQHLTLWTVLNHRQCRLNWWARTIHPFIDFRVDNACDQGRVNSIIGPRGKCVLGSYLPCGTTTHRNKTVNVDKIKTLLNIEELLQMNIIFGPMIFEQSNSWELTCQET
jgi:hypothetical protein